MLIGNQKGTEVVSFQLNTSTRVITILIPNKTSYQKQYGNFITFWGVK